MVQQCKDEKTCEKSFDEYYIQAQEKSQSLEFDDQEQLMPKGRRDLSKIRWHTYNTTSSLVWQKQISYWFLLWYHWSNGHCEKRFSTESIRFLKGFSGLHTSRLNDSETLPKIEALAQFYDNDVDAVALRAEFEVFRVSTSRYKNCESISEILQLLYQWSLHIAYPNVTALYKLCLTLPVTTCSVEHSFSRLKIVKNSLRSTMTKSIDFLLCLC